MDLDKGETQETLPTPIVGLRLVSDIREHATSSGRKAPSPPRIKSSTTGFPAHKDRLKTSRFKQGKQKEACGTKPSRDEDTQIEPSGRRTGIESNRSETYNGQDGRPSTTLDASIDAETKQRLAEMSDDDIVAARKELMSGLSASLLEKLFMKANIDDPSTCSIDGSDQIARDAASDEEMHTKDVTFQDAHTSTVPTSLMTQPAGLSNEDLPPPHPPPDLQPATSKQPLPLLPEIHFPKVPAPPDLDPDDPNFLSNLHSTYFPSLPSDPSTLAWMQPIRQGEQAYYSPSQEALPPSSLRFDFRGHLLPPRLSSQIPSTKGLHHHGHAPDSAGYTIPELSHLARSAVLSQRCIAYQTLGRILYRLGRGDFGSEGEDLCEGLWEVIEKGKVLEGMIDAASKEDGGNRSLWAIATDAVWLWRKGGGRRWNGR
ncbi:MAG: hypothetical protein Q9217_006013 [Psora testacea]